MIALDGAKAQESPFTPCENQANQRYLPHLANSGVPDSRANYESAAHSEVVYSDAIQACKVPYVAYRRNTLANAFGYALAAEFYKCAEDMSLSAKYERKARSLLDRLGAARSDDEVRDFKLAFGSLNDVAAHGCRWSRLTP